MDGKVANTFWQLRDTPVQVVLPVTQVHFDQFQGTRSARLPSTALAEFSKKSTESHYNFYFRQGSP